MGRAWLLSVLRMVVLLFLLCSRRQPRITERLTEKILFLLEHLVCVLGSQRRSCTQGTQALACAAPLAHTHTDDIFPKLPLKNVLVSLSFQPGPPRSPGAPTTCVLGEPEHSPGPPHTFRVGCSQMASGLLLHNPLQHLTAMQLMLLLHQVLIPPCVTQLSNQDTSCPPESDGAQQGRGHLPGHPPQAPAVAVLVPGSASKEII